MKVFVLSQWKERISVTSDGEGRKRNRFGKEYQESILGIS